MHIIAQIFPSIETGNKRFRQKKGKFSQVFKDNYRCIG